MSAESPTRKPPGSRRCTAEGAREPARPWVCSTWARTRSTRTWRDSTLQGAPWACATAPWEAMTTAARTSTGVTLPAFRAYVEAGGVVVWAAGNSLSVNSDVEAVLPRHFPELEKGWLAVVGMGTDGRIAGYSSLCGVAADWCIAAPGELITTRRSGLWDFAGGTSAGRALRDGRPGCFEEHVSEPELPRRARVLATADKSSQYDRREIYG